VRAVAATAKKARIDGSSNKEVTGDRSEELAARVEFTSDTHVAKDPQPTAITTDLKGAVLAKLTYDGTGTESWDIWHRARERRYRRLGCGARRPDAAQDAHAQVADKAERTRRHL
jgi:hypothetical protein